MNALVPDTLGRFDTPGAPGRGGAAPVVRLALAPVPGAGMVLLWLHRCGTVAWLAVGKHPTVCARPRCGGWGGWQPLYTQPTDSRACRAVPIPVAALTAGDQVVVDDGSGWLVAAARQHGALFLVHFRNGQVRSYADPDRVVLIVDRGAAEQFNP